ncbi:MAG TPA: transglutaminase domain-containing protein [Tepidisphaeraceae bacterium]|jgi:transglutaminase-like putative cysteine protease
MNHITDPSGASAIWTTQDPSISKARQLYHAGRLREAEKLLDTPAIRGSQQAVELHDLIARLRFEYSQSHVTLAEKLRQSMADFSVADLPRWVETGEIQTRHIDGEPMIFRREPSNLFRFSPDAIKRRSNPPAKSPPRDYLRQIIDQARTTGQIEVAPVRFHLRYTLKVHGGLPQVKKGSLLRVWLPMPQEYRQQKDVRLISTTPAEGMVAPNGSPHRTIYLEKKVDDPKVEQVFSAEYELTVFAYYPQLVESAVKPLPTDFPKECLSERLPHIPLTPEIRKLAAEITAGEKNPLIAARAIFHWIDRNIAYHAEEEYCLIPSIGTKALALRRGDCGVQAFVFIMLCRAAGIPARWQSGWRLAPDHNNMHDWAEFYIEPYGWIPADPSDGLQPGDDPEIRDFYLGHNDPYRMIVNLDYGSLLIPPKQSLRSEPADFQRGEVEVDGANLYFNQWDYQMERL